MPFDSLVESKPQKKNICKGYLNFLRQKKQWLKKQFGKNYLITIVSIRWDINGSLL